MGYFTGRFNLVEVITLPMLLPKMTSETATKILYDLWREFPEMRKDFKGMKMIMLNPNDPYYFVTKNKPVRTLEDVKGLKLRTIGKYPSMAVKALDANPIMIPMPGLYESAAKGVVDGGLLFHTLMLDLRMYEVFNFWTDAAIYTSIAGVGMNQEKWNSLPPDVKEVIEKSFYDGAIFVAREGFDATKPKVAAAAQKAGKKWERIELNPGELERLKSTVGKPIWEQWAKDMEKKGLPGRKVLDRALELGEKYQ
jgi:TRAP-type C4-dicarboxylate transport system substrate-binding protein